MILILVLIGSFLTLGFLVLLLPPPVFLAFRFVYALIMIGIVPATLSLVSSSVSSSNRGGALSHIGFSRALGVTMGKLVGGFLLVIAGFRWSFATMAVLPIVALPIALALPRDPKNPMEKKNPLIGTAGPQTAQGALPWGDVKRDGSKSGASPWCLFTWPS